MAYFVVENDREYVQLRRRGRFSVEDALVRSPRHREQAVKAVREKMIRDMAGRGYYYVDDGRDELRGPLPHLVVSEDDRTDLAHLAAPDPRDVQAQARFEREEKSRIAASVPVVVNLVDYNIVLTFRKPTGRSFRAVGQQERK